MDEILRTYVDLVVTSKMCKFIINWRFLLDPIRKRERKRKSDFFFTSNLLLIHLAKPKWELNIEEVSQPNNTQKIRLENYVQSNNSSDGFVHRHRQCHTKMKWFERREKKTRLLFVLIRFFHCSSVFFVLPIIIFPIETSIFVWFFFHSDWAQWPLPFSSARVHSHNNTSIS